ncbi:hypothetical protein BKA70DRAFT_1562573 [Coprinopsis sp. MPI-PUGE-AT-0042]|nr:hypothetical protein BKA70DRAFT_1562573 [Coprinopsis sp. MPI-PUGE-AT-0042]
MPEGPEVLADQHVIEGQANIIEKNTGTRPHARVEFHAQTYAVGTNEKGYETLLWSQHDYDPSLEPISPAFTPHPEALAHARKNKENVFTDLINRPHTPGPLFTAVRGKCLVVAAGYHAVTISFGLEASMYVLKRADYEEIISRDCPGTNAKKSKARQLRSFQMPERFIDNASCIKGEKTRLINIFVAFVMDTHAIVFCDFIRLIRLHVNSRRTMWTKEDLAVGSESWKTILWPRFPDGQDWVLEPQDALFRLLEWKQEMLDKAPGYRTSIVKALASNASCAFAGVGRHLANDICFKAAIHPALPCWYVCRDAVLFGRLCATLPSYMSWWRTSNFLSLCATQPNSTNPFAFNYHSDRNYLTSFTHVYYKKDVLVPSELLNVYIESGYTMSLGATSALLQESCAM